MAVSINVEDNGQHFNLLSVCLGVKRGGDEGNDNNAPFSKMENIARNRLIPLSVTMPQIPLGLDDSQPARDDTHRQRRRLTCDSAGTVSRTS